MQILDVSKIASTKLGCEFVPTFHSDATDFVVTLPNLQYGMRDVQNAAEVVRPGLNTTQKSTQIATEKTTQKTAPETTEADRDSLPQTAIRVIQLPNLGLNPRRKRLRRKRILRQRQKTSRSKRKTLFSRGSARRRRATRWRISSRHYSMRWDIGRRIN